MTRPITIALVLSLVAHSAFLLLRIESEPFIESTLPVLDVRLQNATEGVESEPRPAEPVLSGSPPEAVAEDVPPERTEPPAEALDLQRVPQETVTEVDEPPSEPVEPVAERAPEPLKVAEAPQELVIDRPVAVTTPVASDRIVPSTPPETVPPAPRWVVIAEREQRMLDRRIEKWSATFHRMDPTEPTVTWKHRGQAYTASFEQLSAEDDRSIDELLVEISKAEDGETLTTELRLKKLAFSNFAQFIDRWDPNVQIHDDEVGGRFHSNSEISLAFDRRVGPVFLGKVTTSSRGINTENARGGMGRDEMFLGGLETGVRRISMPSEFAALSDESELREDQTHYFERDARVTFYSDGSYGWRYLESTDPEERVTIADESAYLIGAPKTTFHISGIINGSVLVYSPSRIIIEGNLTYTSDPESDPDADDFLGLVSDRIVEVADEKVTGPGDLVIHGSIYAKRRFSVSRFRARGEGTLFIYGSLTAGSISATEPRYRTKISFDPRLENVRAPSFPMTDRYEVAAWDSRWVMR